MKELEPGWIVTVSGMEGQYVVLDVNLGQGATVLLSRDGKKSVACGVPLQSIQIILDQMLAWAHDPNNFLSDCAAGAIAENQQSAKE